MRKRPLIVNMTLIFVIINALIWLILGLLVALQLHPSLPDNTVIRWSMASLSFVAVAILVGLFFSLRRQIPLAWYLTLAFFILSALLTFFDQLGLSDLVVLIINIIPIILLIRDRAWFLGNKSAAMTGQ